MNLPMLAPKPIMGATCNGCGFCCLSEQCSASVEIFGDQDTCPCLEKDAGRYWCGLMRSPRKYDAIPEAFKRIEGDKEIAKELGFSVDDLAAGYWRSLIGQGRGCDSVDEQEGEP